MSSKKNQTQDENVVDGGTAGTSEAGETRTAQRTGNPGRSEYDTQTAGPDQQPQRTSGQRSATTSGDVERGPDEAARMADEQTPATSERIMGLPDSPKAGETGQGH